MIATMAYPLMALALSAAAWSALLLVRDRLLHDPLFWLLALLEAALVAQLVAGVVALATTDRDVEAETFVGYLLTAVLVLPLGLAWAASEKSRWGVGVLAVCCLTVAALLQRALQVWAG